MGNEERSTYESSLKYYRDMNNVVATAKGEGWEAGVEEGIAKGEAKGKAEGKVAIAINCLKQGMDCASIAQITGLTHQEVESLKSQV